MVIKYKKPTAFFVDFVEHFWEKFTPIDQKIDYETETVLPENYLNLTFSLGTSYFRCAEDSQLFKPLQTPQLAAIHTKQNFYKHQPGNHIFGVKFRPGGLYPFTKSDFSELTDISLDLELIFGSKVNILAEELHQLPDFERRIQRMEIFLLQCFIERNLSKFQFIKTAINILSSKNTGADIASLTVQLNTNYKTLSRTFYEVVGIPPKQFAQIRRFESALSLLFSHTDLMTYTDIGYKTGYYDQAHFIREFKKFANQTPTEYLARIKPASVDANRSQFLQFLSPEHLLFYQVEVI